MKLITENWKKFLDEAEERHVAKLGSHVNESFQDIFGNSSRLILNYESTDLDRMNELMSAGVHSVEVERRETEKEGRTVITSVPSVSYTGFKIKFDPETQKRSIGEKVIKKMTLEKYIADYVKFVVSLPQIASRFTSMNHNKAVGLITTFVKFFGIDDNSGDLNANPHLVINQLLSKALQSGIKAIQQEANELNSLFQKNKGELTGSGVEWPEDTSDVLFIFSRDEIDVLRMSDHEGLGSCHSLDGRYDQCVLADAKRDGAIIYSVSKSDFEKLAGGTDQAAVDAFEGKEIFKDEGRGVEGIVPTGRVRVRKVSLQGIEFAVIEDAIYAKFPVGSRDKILKYLTFYLQKSKYKKLKQPVDIAADGIAYGGSASDTGFNPMIREALDLLGIQYVKNTHFDKHSSLEDDDDILDGVTQGDYEYSKKIGDSTISSFIWISNENDGSWFKDAAWAIEAKIDISSMKGKIDFEKLRSTLRTMLYSGLKGFDEFKKYFPNASGVSLVQKGEKIYINFESGEPYGSLDDLPEAIQDLDIQRWGYIDDYSKSMNEILKNPDLLLSMFADFTIEPTLSESLHILKSKFKRFL